VAKYVYGPVPSRRLGRSLGVDLVPMKTCTLNCVYCQLGPTPETTIERAEYAPVDELVEQVRAAIETGEPPDYITLGGSGEPTLHSRFGLIAERIREFARVPMTLLTNGTLFHLPQVRAACKAIDVIIPSLDAGDEEAFRRVNRPHASLTLEGTVQGLVALREEFDGKIWLEVFLVPGMNTSDEDVENLKVQIARINPHKVQLNTAVRPPAETSVHALDAERMEEIRRALGPRTEVVVPPSAAPHTRSTDASEADILNMLQRRPCTVQDVSAGLGIHPNEVIKCVLSLLQQGRITELAEGGKTFYRGV